MLLRFEVSNHRSIRKSAELSMFAVDGDRPAARELEGLSDRVLTVAGIYGPNASGKTNVLDALAWCSAAVAQSLALWDESVPRDPHRFGDGPASPSEFGIEIMVGGVRHDYRLGVDDEAVQHESLYSYPEGRRRTLFERDGMRIEFRRGLKMTGGIEELLSPTTLALTAAMRIRLDPIAPVGREIAGAQTLIPARRRDSWTRPGYRNSTVGLLEREAPRSDLPPIRSDFDMPQPIELLRLADPAIEHVGLVEREDRGRRGYRVEFLHRAGVESAALDMQDQSAGTQTWFRLIGPALVALRDGRALVFDEIDASLHPLLSAHLVELFQDPVTNPHGAQLIFTTHDTSLLHVLNRDEVWLTEKDSDGATGLFGLAEFRSDGARKSQNLERAYLHGRFGAVPEVDQIAVRRALGIVPADPD